MTRIERVRYEMLLRVRDFGTTNQQRFPESSSGSLAFATVAKAVAEIEAHAAAKLVAVREGRQARTLSRKIILDRMKAIARSSRAVRTTAGVLLRLTMPRRRSDVAVVTAARAFLREAEPHRDQLVRLGLPPDGLDELREATDAFDLALAQRRAGRSGVAAAQAGITAALGAGLEAARILDIAVANTVGEDPVLFAAWQRDRRVVERKASAPEEEPPAAGTIAPPDPAAVPEPAPTEPLRRAS